MKTPPKDTHPSKENTDNSALLRSYRSFQMIMRGGMLLFVLLGFVYLITLNSIATQGFDLEKVKKERVQITQELEQVEIDLAIPLSLYALQSSVQIQDMDIIEEKEYIYIKNGRVQKEGNVAMMER